MTNYESKPINLMLMQIVGPALIMMMVASLVFFLIEVSYRGPHTIRLYWVMSFFTFASVLVSRIAIEEGKERSFLYGLALAVATFMTCSTLVEFKYPGLAIFGPVVTIALIMVVMWSSAKLTWDCTVVDRSRDSSATGLVDIFRRKLDLDTNPKSGSGTDTGVEAERGMVARLVRWMTGQREKNTPGIWVFYFGIFAFPVFGIGQWFVQPNSKLWVYVLFAMYLGSTLCLLMTTSLLGLERYLAKRKLHVPAAVARNWMIVGAGFALLMVLLVLLVPKPSSSNHLKSWLANLSSPDRETSKLAPGKDGQKDTPGAKKQRIDNDAKQQGDQPGEQGGGDSKDGPESDEAGEGSSEKKGDQQGGNNKQEQQDKSGNKSNQQKSQQSKNKRQDSKKKQQRNEQNQDEQNQDQNANKQKNEQPKAKQQRDRNENQKQENKQQNNNRRKAQPESNPSQLQQLMQSVTKFMNWVIYLIGFIALAFVIWVFRAEIAKFLNSLFGKKKPQPKIEEAKPQPEFVAPLPSYRSFSDPFRSGKVNSMRAKQVLEYSMDALQAWSREFGLDTEHDLTPEELSQQIGTINETVSHFAKELASLYGRCAFSRDSVSREELNPLIKLWRQMDLSFAQKQRQTPLATQT